MVDIQAVDLVGMDSLVEGNSGIGLQWRTLVVVPVEVRHMAVPPVEVGMCILEEM